MEKKRNFRFKPFFFTLSLIFIFTLKLYGFSFVVVGDSRNGENPAKILTSIMEETNLLSPDFTVHTGDWVAYPSKEGWESFLKVMKIGGIPFHLTIGNHETSKNWEKWASLYEQMIKKPLYYSFEYEKCSFIILCCYSEEKEKTIRGKIDNNQFLWLEKELQKAEKSDFIFVFVHEPLYPSGPHKNSSLDRFPSGRDRLSNLLRKYNDKNKLIVFCGHEHLYDKKTVNGLTQIITAGAGAPLYSSPEKGGFYHYLYVTIKEGKLSIAVIKPGNIFSSELEKKEKEN